MQTMRDQIVARIERLGEGKAFSAKDFLDIASRTTIDVTLAELTLDGTIRRREHAQAKEPHACGEFSDPRSRSPQG